MKKSIKIIGQIPKYTAYSFSMCMVVFLTIALIAQVREITVSRIIQLLAVCIIGAVLQMISFTDIIIKKMLYIKRLALFMFPFLAVITAFAVKYSWFPLESILSWIIFIGIFTLCFIISAILFEIHFKITGDKYTGFLNEYKNKNQR